MGSLQVLVAGATGYLGGHVLQELRRRGAWVRALARRPEQRAGLLPWSDEVAIAQVTEPSTLSGVAAGVDVVFSAVGITRQRDGATYEDVDHRGNAHLLAEAIASGARRFVYVSIFDGPRLRQVPLVDAKERFVAALAASPLPHCVIRPTGFFSDMADLLAMARRGPVVLFGDGTARINPISGRDLAVACADAMTDGRGDLDVGGPEVLSYNAIAALAFAAAQRRPRVWHLADRYTNALVGIARTLAPRHIAGPLEFVTTVTRRDMVAPPHGHDRLEDFFRSES